MKKTVFLITTLLFTVISVAQNNPLWMRYPAISPNGQRIAFNYMGDIYTVSIKGGEAKRITTGEDMDYKAVWSPDSKQIAFASNKYGNFDIYVVSAEGGIPKRLTFHSGNEKPASFTPDGKFILFSAAIQDVASSVSFPRSYINELYQVPVEGGRIKQVLSTPAEEAHYNKSMTKLVYQDAKGPENIWRKHHKSSVAKDIRIYDLNTKTHKIITNNAGEDRMPVFSADETAVYYISDVNSTAMNICKMDMMMPEVPVQITHFEKNPVRFLSISDNDILCFGYMGEIYVGKEGKSPLKINIKINTDAGEHEIEYVKTSSGAREMTISPDGTEIALIIRGNVFVTSTEYASTKQITNTPGQERSVSFSPDGKHILYAAERNGSWNIYQTSRVNENEPNFALSTLLKEEAVVETDAEEFQPKYSPDGKEVAYLHERTELRVINLKTKAVRTVLNGDLNYSYSDGDQDYEWSPDSKYFLVQYSPNMLFNTDIGLINADGSDAEKPINLTQSGYMDSSPKWSLKGNAMIWKSDRNGYRSHGSWGAYRDVYAMFFNEKSYNKFVMSKEDFEIYKKEQEAKNKKDTTDKKDEKNKPLEFEQDNLDKRIKRLTINSSSISDMILSPDGEKLFYLAKFEKGYDLWVHELRENKTKLALKLSGYGGGMQLDKDGKNLYIASGGNIYKIDTKSYAKTPVSYVAEYELDKFAERKCMYEHVCRTINKKFYKKDMHGTDWDFYTKEYAKFLPYINNNFDFSEMLSELLGELNASHTGSGYRYRKSDGDKTAALGALYDWNYNGNGLKINEILAQSPLGRIEPPIKKGTIIEKIDDKEITNDKDWYQYLNHKEGKITLISLYDPASKTRRQETLRPISLREMNDLLYERWVENRRAECDSISGGRIGYVHVKGMNSASFRQVYSDALGKNFHKDAIIIDTRYNHGGWLHDDLATLFSGKKYVEFVPRGHEFGYDPMTKWVKPSVLLMSEGNYSDAHAFPFVYKTLNIGKTVGMPVPGTMTAVWWETLQDRSLYFGMPEIGARDMNGNFLENTQLEPDYKVDNDYDVLIKNKDQQLEKAVQVLLEDVKNNTKQN